MTNKIDIDPDDLAALEDQRDDAKIIAALRLDPHQERFCREYVATMNKASACVAAGYPAGSGPKLMRNEGVLKFIDYLRVKIANVLEINATMIMRESANLAFFDPQDLYDERGALKSVRDMDQRTRATIASLETTEERDDEGNVTGRIRKLKLWDKNKALDRLARFQGLFERDNKQVGEAAAGSIAGLMASIYENGDDLPVADPVQVSESAQAPDE